MAAHNPFKVALSGFDSRHLYQLWTDVAEWLGCGLQIRLMRVRISFGPPV